VAAGHNVKLRRKKFRLVLDKELYKGTAFVCAHQLNSYFERLSCFILRTLSEMYVITNFTMVISEFMFKKDEH